MANSVKSYLRNSRPSPVHGMCWWISGSAGHSIQGRARPTQCPESCAMPTMVNRVGADPGKLAVGADWGGAGQISTAATCQI